MSRLEEIEQLVLQGKWAGRVFQSEWLKIIKQAKRVKELEEENRKLNHEIGKYSGDIHEKSRNIINECTELRLVAKKMLKGESDD